MGNAVFQASVSLQGKIRNQHIVEGAGIQASKLIHHSAITRELVAEATEITAVSSLLHISQASIAEILAFQAFITTAATGSDRTVDVDLLKSTGGNAFASILTAPIAFIEGDPDRSVTAALLSNADLVAGDVLKVDVTVSGSDPDQAEGLLVALTLRDRPSV